MDSEKNIKRSPELGDALSDLPSEERAAILRTWELLGRAAPEVENVPGLDDAWADLQQRIQNLPEVTPQQAPADRPPRRAHRHSEHHPQQAPRSARRNRSSHGPTLRRSLVAGGLLIALAAIGAWIWQRPLTAVAPAGQTADVILADGSTIHLNSGTRLQYRRRALPGSSGQLRSVTLDGEAFFEVEPGETTFTVETPSAVVEVLGTRFNVRARTGSGEGGTEVTLASGRVRVAAREDAGQSALLSRPGDQARIMLSMGPDSTLVTDTATLDYVLAWRSNAFAAIDRPVGAILSEIERKYGLSIQVENQEMLANSMTLLYGPDTEVELILHDICLVQGCRYRPISGGGFALFAPASNPRNM